MRYSYKARRYNRKYLRKMHRSEKMIPLVFLLLVIGLALIVWMVK